MKKKIAIIGAGIAGLTLANLVKKYTDHEFMVYEREESLSLEEGYGIQLATNSIKILNQISFDKINDQKIFHPKSLDFYNIQNEKICDLNLSKFNSPDAKYTTLQRSILIEFLKEDVYTQHLRFGKKIKEVENNSVNKNWKFLKNYKNSISNLSLNINLYYKFSNKIPKWYNWYSLENNKEFIPSFTKRIFNQVSSLF